MSLTQEDLQAISSLLDDVKKELKQDIKRSERKLSAKIDSSENLILDEVERVHNILHKHVHDKTKHSA